MVADRTLVTVVKNPLSPIEHPGGLGVNCQLFELGLEQFIVSQLRWRTASIGACLLTSTTSSDRIIIVLL